MRGLYAGQCPDCGGLCEHIVLSNTEKDRLQKAFNKVARWAFKEKKTNVTADDLEDKDVRPLVDEINSVLTDAITSGISLEIPDALMQHLKQNIYVFSVCKTYAELRDISDLLVNEKGEIKSFSKFFKDVKQVHSDYNKNYLESEYQFASQSAEMASKWSDYEKDGDQYNLQYRTANDDRVRYEHQALHNVTLPPSDPFWSKYFPPNGWRCRCNTVQVRKESYPETDSATANMQGEQATYTVGKGNVNTSAMFRFNPGKDKVIFPATHPYFNHKAIVEQLKEKAAERPLINVKDYIRGTKPTNAETENILLKYAELKPEDFRRGLAEVKCKKTGHFFMCHSMRYVKSTNEWVGKSEITISSQTFSVMISGKTDTFNPADEFKGALAALKKGKELTFKQEYSVESLWHEILHAKTKTKRINLGLVGTQEMETINQFCARHTYDKFLESLGGKARHKNEILEEGFGYKNHVADFRRLLKTNGIEESKAVEKLMPKLLSDYSNIGNEVKAFIEKYKK